MIFKILHRKARKVETEIRMQITAEEAGTGRIGLNVSLPELTIIMDYGWFRHGGGCATQGSRGL